MRLLWLPDVLRDAGLVVHGVPGWRTRGADSFGPVRGITCHHTAGSRTSSDEGEIRTLVNGRPGLAGPIAQLYLSRSGEWWVVASGHCNHNKVGWGGPNRGFGNDSLLGIEAQHSGGDEPWTDRQYDSYVRGVAALVRHDAPGWDVTVARVAGHKEHQPGDKPDPTFGMTRFRADVARLIEEGDVTAEDVWTRKQLITAPAGREDKSNTHFTPANTLTWIANWTFTGAASAARAEATAGAVLQAVRGADAATIIREIQAQGEKTRATLAEAVLRQGETLAPQLAARVAQQLEGEFDETAIGEALARELAQLLLAGAASPGNETGADRR